MGVVALADGMPAVEEGPALRDDPAPQGDPARQNDPASLNDPAHESGAARDRAAAHDGDVVRQRDAVRLNDPARQRGAVRDGAVRDGAVRDGAVRDGAVRDDAVCRTNAVRDGGAAFPDGDMVVPDRTQDLDDALSQRLDELVLSAARSGVPWLDAELTRLLRRPGKRIRPGLVLAAARCGPFGANSAALTCAAAMELLHRSTLVHDDLMDNAPYRGDQLTLHQTSGLAGALLGGDYLYGAGGRMIAGVSMDAAVVWHDAYVNVCDGQARETANRYRPGTPVEYLQTIRGKTAALIRAACQLGAMSGGLRTGEIAALATFGECFGVVFQLVDDLMDVVSTPALWGKPVQHDVGQGVYTLPVLAGAGRVGIRLGPDLDGDAIAQVYDATRRYALGPAVESSYAWADRAAAALHPVRPSAARDGLRGRPEAYLTGMLATRVAPAYRQLIAPVLRHY